MGSIAFNRVALLLGLLVAILASDIRKTTAYGNSPMEAGRSLVEAENSSQSSQMDQTERVDPLDGFKKYKGGYNITNKHYWSSTLFTGIPGYSIAAVWLLSGLVYGGFLLITLCLKQKRRKEVKRFPCTNRCCFWPILIGFSFTFLAIISSGVVLAGSSRFHSRANSVKNIIQETADQASDTIYNVTRAVNSMQDNMEGYGDIEGSTRLNSTSEKLNNEASRIQRKATKIMSDISMGLKILCVTTAVIVSLNLVFVLALLGMGFLKPRRPFHLLIVLCWVMTFLFWMYFGLYFFIDRFSGDTCTALEEYRQDPRNSSLSSILPCNDQLKAKTALRDTREGIYELIDQVNANISIQKASSLPDLVYVCNPFSGPPEYNYKLGNCSSNTIPIGDIPQMLKRYTCSDSDSGACGIGQFISANVYSRVLVYTTSVQNLLNSFPGMERLVNCQLVKDAFTAILSEQCKPLKKNVHMTWAAMAALSTIMMFIIFTWVVVAHHDGKNHSSDGSVNPRSTHSDTSEVDTAEMFTKQLEPI